MKMERIGCFLDIKVSMDPGTVVQKRLDLDEYVTDMLETKNIKVLMKKVHNIIQSALGKIPGT